jgi:sigma-B regulation protein RsbU (phosphoserine phosphatase)
VLIADEEARLAAVGRYDVLDTPPDGAFDRVTALAARHFGVPIALVTIVDTDRIWFKSRHGLDVQEISRDPGLCSSAIMQDGPWVVEDAAIDPRTLANPLVAGEMGLRFYAGVPLRTSDGFNLGTLCLIDQEPRHLTVTETETLADMAAIVMDQLELRLSARRVHAQEHELRTLAERTAASLQQSLLPGALPAIPGADLAAFYRPADDAEVGGDFYDVFAVRDGEWVLAIGDVSGKGPAAAAVTALVRHTIRAAAMSAADPVAVLQTLNEAMFLGGAAEPERFCTVHVSFLRADGPRFELRSASAGHPLGLVHRQATQRVDRLLTSGPPVGWHRDPQFAGVTSTLHGGDVMLIYTDGLSEARAGSKLLEEREIEATLHANRQQPAQAVVSSLVQTLARPDVDVRDDAAALVVRVV